MHIAIVGCSHGEVDKIYEAVHEISSRRNIKIELVLCCGDFQSVRNMTDLRCMACPIKYQAMHDFHRYYSGEKTAPVTTIFIGGNHEASNYLQELPFGGWVAPNIYFSGNANVLKFGSLRIACVSGIYKGHDFLKGRFECPPYDNSTIRSVYHYRNLDIFRLKQMSNSVDIVMSHDWPKGIHQYGDFGKLIRRKPFFQEEIEKNELGSRPLEDLLFNMKPKYWFSAHMHVKFPAIVSFPDRKKDESSETDAGDIPTCNFLALDKVLPRRQFLQILEVPDDSGIDDKQLSYDPEWLAVLRSTDNLLHSKSSLCYMPNEKYNGRFDYVPTPEEIAEAEQMFENTFVIPQNFCKTGPVYNEGDSPRTATPLVNPQTVTFCEKLGIRDPVAVVKSLNPVSLEGRTSYDLLSEPHMYESQLNITCNENSFIEVSINPDEIDLDADEPDDTGEKVESGNSGTPKLKLSLPTPQASALDLDSSEAPATEKVDKKDLDILKSIFGSEFSVSSEVADDSQNPGNDAPLFTLDKVGEPTLKKRRNANIYDDS